MKRMLLFSIALMLFLSCGDENATSEAESAIEKSFIDLPDSISKNSAHCTASITQKVNRATLTAENTVAEIYEGIRSITGAVEAYAEFAKEMAVFVEEDILSHGKSSGDWSNENPGETDASRITWGASDKSEYETLVTVYFTDSTSIAMKIYLTTLDTAAKGLIIYDSTQIPGTETQQVEIEFDGTTDSKSLKVVVVNIPKEDDGSGVTQGWIEATENSDGIINCTMAYQFIPPTDDVFYSDGVSRTYTAVSSAENGGNAVIKLALPTATTDTITNIWEDYSIGQITKNLCYPKLITDLKSGSATIAEIQTTTGLTLPADFDSLTHANIDDILAWFSTNSPDNSDLGDFIYITQLVNPAYFTTTGFLGTYDGTTGTLTAAPSWASSFTLDSITPIVPATLAGATFNSELFEISK